MGNEKAELRWIVERLLAMELDRDPSKTRRDVIEKWERLGAAPSQISGILLALK
jgi:hypothetical protein